jgi:peptide/nickel transport system permease protein
MSAALEEEGARARSPLSARVRKALSTIAGNKALLIGTVISGTFTILALAEGLAKLFGVSLTPYNPLQTFVGQPFESPSWLHLFGTDELGRDVFSRILDALPNDLSVSLAIVSVAFAFGVTLGALAGYKGGWFDEALMRVTDVFFALPAIILAIAVTIIIGPGLIHITYVLMLIWWPGYARLSRGLTLRLVQQNFIDAARLSGSSQAKILFRHIIPNTVFLLVIFATVDIGGVMLVFAGLSYLGLAVPPPTPDLGSMVNAYQDYMLTAPWLPLLPGLLIALIVIGFSVLGDGLQEVTVLS